MKYEKYKNVENINLKLISWSDFNKNFWEFLCENKIDCGDIDCRTHSTFISRYRIDTRDTYYIKISKDLYYPKYMQKFLEVMFRYYGNEFIISDVSY